MLVINKKTKSCVIVDKMHIADDPSWVSLPRPSNKHHINHIRKHTFDSWCNQYNHIVDEYVTDVYNALALISDNLMSHNGADLMINYTKMINGIVHHAYETSLSTYKGFHVLK